VPRQHRREALDSFLQPAVDGRPLGVMDLPIESLAFAGHIEQGEVHVATEPRIVGEPRHAQRVRARSDRRRIRDQRTHPPEAGPWLDTEGHDVVYGTLRVHTQASQLATWPG
jgi:hypothetical protein